MKTVFFWLVLLFFAYVLQSSICNVISYNDITVNLILLMTVFLSIIYDKYAILFGFYAGLFQDLASGTFLGIYAFSLLIVCIVASKASERIYKDNIFLPLVASFVATVLLNVMVAVLIYLLGYTFDIVLIINDVLIELIYNLIFAYPVFFLMNKIDCKFNAFLKKFTQY